MRQCWYWTESQHPNCGSGESDSIIMAYDDALNVDFWGGLRPPNIGNPTLIGDCKPRYRGESGDARLRDNWKDHLAPAELVAEMHRELLEVHNVQSAPQPIQAAYVDWSDDPFGAGSHLWNRGVKSWAIVKEMTQPIPDLPCYVCGEAYATIQGWVEGALETAEIVLQERLDLPAPAWLPAQLKSALGFVRRPERSESNPKFSDSLEKTRVLLVSIGADLEDKRLFGGMFRGRASP
jgi:hypothetical protein